MGEDVFAQPGSGARFDWGPAGAAELARVCSILVVVDVLSFSTAVDVAVSRGMRVHPFPWGEQADAYASRIGATVAAGRSRATAAHPWSLSPAALVTAPVVADLVIPALNGATICAAAASTGVPVVAACVRNAAAVARWLLLQGYGRREAPVGVVAAGESWPDGTLRPCVEDLLGAALLLDRLAYDEVALSVEAAVTLAAYASVPDVAAAITRSASGQELIGRGFPQDVSVAIRTAASSTVPLLRGDAFQPAN